MTAQIHLEGTVDSQLANRQIEREEIWGEFRQYISVNNIDISEYDLKIWFDREVAIGMSCDGYERDIIFWREENHYEVRQPKNKEVRYWETTDINEAFDIMMDRSTPKKYKRLI